MRCKCGFNTFDHHLVCPKCHKDLTATRRLLNLDFPAPGRVDFFQVAGRKMAGPPPGPGPAAGSEDFGEDLQPVEDIRPITHAADQSPPMEKTEAAQPGPGGAVSGAAAPETTPAPPQAFADLIEEPLNEIEMTDDFEVDPPGGRPWPEASFTQINPGSHHQAVMDQIKSALTETGDLNPEMEPAVRAGRSGTPGAPASNRTGPSVEDEVEELSSLIGDLNLDELEGDL